MSDAIKHECGIALLRLKKPLSFYKEKYGTAFYGIQKMYLLMEKQHNRGQDGAGLASIKFDMQPGQRYISRLRSNQSQPIQDVFTQINARINEELAQNPDKINDIPWQKGQETPRAPMSEHDIIFYVRPEPPHELSGGSQQEIPIRIKMTGDIRRLMYYPDGHKAQYNSSEEATTETSIGK
jgi:hypothetical protein